MRINLGFQPEAVLSTGEHAVGVLLGLDSDNLGGLLAKGDLCRCVWYGQNRKCFVHCSLSKFREDISMV